MFGENSLEHPEDYSGVSPGYTPEFSERRARKCALRVGLPGDTLTRRQRCCIVSFLLRLDLHFPFPAREHPAAARQICEMFSRPQSPKCRGGPKAAPALYPVSCILSSLPFSRALARDHRLLHRPEARRVETVEVDAARHLMAAAVFRVPTHRVGTRLLVPVRQRTHGPAGDVIHPQADVTCGRQRVVDLGPVPERVGPAGGKRRLRRYRRRACALLTFARGLLQVEGSSRISVGSLAG